MRKFAIYFLSTRPAIFSIISRANLHAFLKKSIELYGFEFRMFLQTEVPLSLRPCVFRPTISPHLVLPIFIIISLLLSNFT
jgi:hypothetical protein